jgi:hypothetical protein
MLHRGDRRTLTTKQVRETEAEAVAFVVAILTVVNGLIWCWGRIRMADLMARILVAVFQAKGGRVDDRASLQSRD